LKVKRLKNGHSLSDEDAAVTMHYRVMLVNGVFVVTEVTFDVVADHLQAQSQVPGDRFAKAAAFVRENLGGKPIQMMVEVQIIPKPYLELRKLSHFLYKFNRSEDPHLLCHDLVPSEAKFVKASEGDFGQEPTYLEQVGELTQWRATEVMHYLSSNSQIVPAKCLSIAKMLEVTTTLVRLDMSQMNLNDCLGLKTVLVSGIKQNASLVELNLSANKLGDAAGLVLLESL